MHSDMQVRRLALESCASAIWTDDGSISVSTFVLVGLQVTISLITRTLGPAVYLTVSTNFLLLSKANPPSNSPGVVGSGDSLLVAVES